MQNTCRSSEITHISSFIPPDWTERASAISDLYTWAEKNVTKCNGCDELSKITITSDGEDYLLPCPVFTDSCKYGETQKVKAKTQAIESLRDVVPRNIAHNLQKPRQTMALMQARNWNMNGILYLYGDTGKGKSFAAAWILYNHKLQQFLKNLRFPMMWNAKADSIAWMSAYRAVSDKLYINTCCYSSLLVLDDLGEEVNTPSTKATISEIINERYNRNSITIITSNLSMTDIESRYSKRVQERLANKSTTTIVQCLGENQRINSD